MGDLPDRAIVARRVHPRGAGVVGQEINGARIGAPVGILGIAIERAGEQFRARAVGVDHVQLANGITAQRGIGGHPGNLRAVGRYYRVFVAVRVVRKPARDSIGEVKGINLAIGGRDDDRLAVTCPGRFADGVEVGAGDVLPCAAAGRDDEKSRMGARSRNQPRCDRRGGQAGRFCGGATGAVKAIDCPSRDQASASGEIPKDVAFAPSLAPSTASTLRDP